MATPESAAIFINGEAIPGLEDARLTIFGNQTVSGIAEIVETNSALDNELLYDHDLILFLGEESMVRNLSFAPRSDPDMFDYVKMIAPSGLITFGVNYPVAARKKPYGTHMDIVLREWGKGNGPVAPFLGAVIEGVYQRKRIYVLDALSEQIGSRAISMSSVDNSIYIELSENKDVSD